MKQGYLREEDLLSYIPILEKAEQMKDSIFASAYAQAFSAIGNIIRDQKVQKKQEDELANGNSRILKKGISPNIVMVNGGRGSGKTSTMKSVVNYLVKERRSEEQLYPEEFLRIKNEKMNFVTVELVDPSLFEDDTSIMHIVLGGMFIKVEKAMNDTSHTISQWERRQILAAFQEVFEGIKFLDKQKKKMGLTELEELKYTADVLEMTSKVKDLIDNYLKNMTGEKESKLIIPIDDMDLNSRYAYKMLEEIRKYFSTSNIIIILAANKDQLIMDITQVYMENYKMTLDNELYKANDMIEMAERYMEKLVPTGYRIALPNLEDAELNGVKVKYSENEIEEYEIPISDYLRKKIFEVSNIYLSKYSNSRVQTSQIIGDNLRMYANTINILKSINNGGDDNITKEKDENYYTERLRAAQRYQTFFIEEWCTHNMNNDMKNELNEIFREDSSSTNKKIIDTVNYRFNEKVEKYQENEDGMTLFLVKRHEYKSVTHQDNRPETISFGDVQFVINYILENINLSKQEKSYFFAIKMIMSFKLFNSITRYKQECLSNGKQVALKNKAEYFHLINGSILNTAETISYYTIAPNPKVDSVKDRLTMYSKTQKLFNYLDFKMQLNDVFEGLEKFELKNSGSQLSKSNIERQIYEFKKLEIDEETIDKHRIINKLIFLEMMTVMIMGVMPSRNNEITKYRIYGKKMHQSIDLAKTQNRGFLWDMTCFWMNLSFSDIEEIPNQYKIYWNEKDIHDLFEKILGPYSIKQMLKNRSNIFYVGSVELIDKLNASIEVDLSKDRSSSFFHIPYTRQESKSEGIFVGNNKLRSKYSDYHKQFLNIGKEGNWINRLLNYLVACCKFKEENDWKTFEHLNSGILKQWIVTIVSIEPDDLQDFTKIILEEKENDSKLEMVNTYITSKYFYSISKNATYNTIIKTVEGLLENTEELIQANQNNERLDILEEDIKKMKGILEEISMEKDEKYDKYINEYNEEIVPSIKEKIDKIQAGE